MKITVWVKFRIDVKLNSKALKRLLKKIVRIFL